MNKPAVRIKNWPFSKGEKARLIWIGEPFRENNKWMLYAYFRGKGYIKKIMLDWAALHFLSIDKCYKDGDLNNGVTAEDEKTVDISLTNIKPEYIEKDWAIWGTGFKTKSKTFNFYKKGVLYTVPIIEVVRAVLAPDRFMLNRILETDTLKNYFLYEINEDKLQIFFTSEYQKNLLSDEKINHIAWILTNPKVFRMFESIGKNLWFSGNFRFDFLLENFCIKARVNENGTNTRIKEIIAFKKKRINANVINIYHPSLKILQPTDEAKKSKYIRKVSDGTRELDAGADGSAGNSELTDTLLITHLYERLPVINRIRKGREDKRTKEDKDTRTFFIDNGAERTVADEGGETLLTGLEFKSLADIQEKGELGEFTSILKILRGKSNIKTVEITIGELPGRSKGRKFSKLNDGITKRKYAIGKITMLSGRECSIIDIQREDKALSMLILKAVEKMRWKWIYSRLLIELVNENGTWSNQVIEYIKRQGIAVLRCRHISKTIYEKTEHIYEKLK